MTYIIYPKNSHVKVTNRITRDVQKADYYIHCDPKSKVVSLIFKDGHKVTYSFKRYHEFTGEGYDSWLRKVANSLKVYIPDQIAAKVIEVMEG